MWSSAGWRRPLQRKAPDAFNQGEKFDSCLNQQTHEFLARRSWRGSERRCRKPKKTHTIEIVLHRKMLPMGLLATNETKQVCHPAVHFHIVIPRSRPEWISWALSPLMTHLGRKSSTNGVKLAASYFSLVTIRSDLSGLLSAAETRGEAYNADFDSQLISNQQVHCLHSLSISCSRRNRQQL